MCYKYIKVILYWFTIYYMYFQSVVNSLFSRLGIYHFLVLRHQWIDVSTGYLSLYQILIKTCFGDKHFNFYMAKHCGLSNIFYSVLFTCMSILSEFALQLFKFSHHEQKYYFLAESRVKFLSVKIKIIPIPFSPPPSRRKAYYWSLTLFLLVYLSII